MEKQSVGSVDGFLIKKILRNKEVLKKFPVDDAIVALLDSDPALKQLYRINAEVRGTMERANAKDPEAMKTLLVELAKRSPGSVENIILQNRQLARKLLG